MKIVVCPISRLQSTVALYHPDRVVSLLDPESTFPELGLQYVDRHLQLRVHDVHDSASGQVAPASEHIDQLIEFISNWERSTPIVIHCRAGIGRSTAAAFITACLHSPHMPELDIARELRSVSALARPNELLVHLADEAMSRGGRMIHAIRETGRHLAWEGVSENVPFELLLREDVANAKTRSKSLT